MKGWTPVRRINLGSLGTCASGVTLSTAKTCGTGFAGGGRGKSGSVADDVSDLLSSPCTVSGGVGGSCTDFESVYGSVGKDGGALCNCSIVALIVSCRMGFESKSDDSADNENAQEIDVKR